MRHQRLVSALLIVAVVPFRRLDATKAALEVK